MSTEQREEEERDVWYNFLTRKEFMVQASKKTTDKYI